MWICRGQIISTLTSCSNGWVTTRNTNTPHVNTCIICYIDGNQYKNLMGAAKHMMWMCRVQKFCTPNCSNGWDKYTSCEHLVKYALIDAIKKISNVQPKLRKSVNSATSVYTREKRPKLMTHAKHKTLTSFVRKISNGVCQIFAILAIVFLDSCSQRKQCLLFMWYFTLKKTKRVLQIWRQKMWFVKIVSEYRDIGRRENCRGEGVLVRVHVFVWRKVAVLVAKHG